MKIAAGIIRTDVKSLQDLLIALDGAIETYAGYYGNKFFLKMHLNQSVNKRENSIVLLHLFCSSLLFFMIC